MVRDNRAVTIRNVNLAVDALNYGSMAWGVGGLGRGLLTLAMRNPRLAFQTADAIVSTTNAAAQFGRVELTSFGQIAPHIHTVPAPRPPLRWPTSELLR